MTTATEAIQRLKEGNARYAAGQPRSEDLASPARRDELVAGQAPFAIILGCADSRVPAELVFDQGLGDIFVIRVAGNIAASSQMASVEYAAAVCGARLVVVLGHSNCGAIAATVDEVSKPSGLPSPSLTTLVDRIRPSVEDLVQNAGDTDRATLIADGVRANVQRQVESLSNDSPILKDLIATDGLQVVGAEYALETGAVTFYE